LVALALAGACGGTTGLERITASSSGDDAGEDTRLGKDASVAWGGESTIDSASSDVGDEAIGRPPPRDTGVFFAAGDGDPAHAGDASSFELADGGVTTLTLLAAQGPACLSFDRDGGPSADSCVVTSGCLDPAQLGGTCETEPEGGVAPASGRLDYRQMCLKTLNDIFASNCAAGPLLLTPCICGTADPAQCLVGSVAPSGGLPWDDYVNDFGTTDPRTVESMIVLQTYGSGQADALIQCLAIDGCTACLGTAPADAAVGAGD
jgi:hypothetical protein